MFSGDFNSDLMTQTEGLIPFINSGKVYLFIDT